jgi:hypothetical protein
MYLLLIVVALLAQAVPGQKKPSFEIVSIKPSPPGNGPRGAAPRGDRLVITSSTLRMLLQNAYPPPQGVNRQLEIMVDRCGSIRSSSISMLKRIAAVGRSIGTSIG